MTTRQANNGLFTTYHGGKEAKGVITDHGEFPLYGSGGRFGSASDWLYEGEGVIFGRKGTIDSPTYVNGKFWLIDTGYFAKPDPETHPKFFYYWATTIPFLLFATNTARPSVTAHELARQKMPVYDQETQQRIADYLDVETGQIDTTVSTLDDLIEEMGARRERLIGEVIGNGTPQSSDLLGNYKHKYASNGLFVDYYGGKDASHTSEDGGEFPLYGSGGKFGNASEWLYEGEGVVFGRKGTVDRPQYVNGKFWLVDTGYFAKPSVNINPKFFYYWSTTIPFHLITTSTALPSVTSNSLSRQKLPVIPLETQERIADYLDKETEKIDGIVATARELRSELLARRSALITEVVTGQRQV